MQLPAAAARTLASTDAAGLQIQAAAEIIAMAEALLAASADERLTAADHRVRELEHALERLPEDARRTLLADEVEPIFLAADLLLRRLWLNRVGPHAVVRSVRVSGERAVLSLTVRPGRLTNRLSGLETRFHGSSGLVHRVRQTVFAGYRRQWSLSLAVAVDRAALDAEDQLAVWQRLTADDGETVDLPVQAAAADFLQFARYPTAGSLQPWTFELLPARSGATDQPVRD